MCAIQTEAFERDDGLRGIGAHITDIKTPNIRLVSDVGARGESVQDLLLHWAADKQLSTNNRKPPHPDRCHAAEAGELTITTHYPRQTASLWHVSQSS